MKNKHRWDMHVVEAALRGHSSKCRACGQPWSALRPTAVCPCWKMRLPRKEK